MSKLAQLALTAALALATALTLSCSDDSGGSDPSSSSLLSSSDVQAPGSSSSGQGSIAKAKISGLSQKGPFVKGTRATLYELNENFIQTGRSFFDIIADDRGNFEIKDVELASPYALLEADGFYRNEVTGGISKASIKLYAIADVREKDNININLLTHLEYYRVLALAEGGKTIAEAKKQAQKEILAVFGIDGAAFASSEDMSIFGTAESDAALLAISVLMQGDLSEGEFSQRLTDFALSLKTSGKWDSGAEKNRMADWAAGADLDGISGKILAWGLSDGVPDFGKYANNYWYVNYGLGECNAGSQNSVKNSNRGMDYICKNNAWLKATEYESDTYGWGSCIAEGELKAGNTSSNYYVCDNAAWRAATDYEKDIQLACVSSNEGNVKIGTDGIAYVCKGSEWARAKSVDIAAYKWECTEANEGEEKSIDTCLNEDGSPVVYGTARLNNCVGHYVNGEVVYGDCSKKDSVVTYAEMEGLKDYSYTTLTEGNPFIRCRNGVWSIEPNFYNSTSSSYMLTYPYTWWKGDKCITEL